MFGSFLAKKWLGSNCMYNRRNGSKWWTVTRAIFKTGLVKSTMIPVTQWSDVLYVGYIEGSVLVWFWGDVVNPLMVFELWCSGTGEFALTGKY